jgi:2-keto-3-deoxy-L-rhamnonate aldolase RhmA
MKTNRLRQLLNEGKPTIGTHVISPWPSIVEIIGHSEVFDYIELVGEYSPFSLQQMEDFGRAIELFSNMSSMMKVEEQTRGFITGRAIDSGIQNVLFTDVRTADDVRDCVRMVHAETPEAMGVHGAGMRRNVGYVLEGGSQAWVDAMNQVVIAVMIEKKSAMDELPEILAIPGLDMVQFGPSDYSVSIGKAGQGRSAEVQDVQKRMIEMALKAGKHPRVEIAGLDQAQPFLSMGVRHFCVGWDVSVLFAWCKQQGKLMEELGLKNAASSPDIQYPSAQR